MIWLVWRRQRTALLFCLMIVVAISTWLVVGRFVALDNAESTGVQSCLGRGPNACGSPGWADFVREINAFWGLVRSVLLIVPAIMGIAAGASLFGREFDHGTHVFALTQSVSRLRWWTTGLIVAGIPVVLGIGLLSLLTDWAFSPFVGTLPTRGLFAPVFETSGIAPMAYTLLAFGIASATGLLMRNSIGAAAVTLLALLITEFALGQFARSNYSAPSRATGPLTETDGLIDATPLPQGALRLADGFIDSQGEQIPSSFISCTTVDCLRKADISSSYALYQPLERYWLFQLTESAICAVLAAAVLGVSFVALRRRVS